MENGSKKGLGSHREVMSEAYIPETKMDPRHPNLFLGREI